MIEHCKHGTIETEALHIRAKRAYRDTAVTKKWHIQEPNHGPRQRGVANANPFPVEGQKYDRQQFDGYS